MGRWLERMARKTDKIIMSIKPKYVNLIFSGSKKFELRKKIPESIDEIFIYSSYPVQRVVGKFKIKKIIRNENLAELWRETTSYGENPENVGVTFEEFKDYFREAKECCAIEISDLKIFKERKKLSDFDIEKAPQSWCYMRKEL